MQLLSRVRINVPVFQTSELEHMESFLLLYMCGWLIIIHKSNLFWRCSVQWNGIIYHSLPLFSLLWVEGNTATTLMKKIPLKQMLTAQNMSHWYTRETPPPLWPNAEDRKVTKVAFVSRAALIRLNTLSSSPELCEGRTESSVLTVSPLQERGGGKAVVGALYPNKFSS